MGHRVAGAAGVELGQFLGSQDLLGEAVAVARQGALDAVDAQQVHADAADGGRRGDGGRGFGLGHRCGAVGRDRARAQRPRSASRRACTISAFMSRTAFSQPSNTACATMAWPMLSSEMPSSAATGLTLP